MDQPPRTDDSLTLVAAGVLAVTLTTVWHETVGHGAACLAEGGRITLLTAIVFRCRGATAFTDAGGPLASLLAGVVIFALLRVWPPRRLIRRFLVLLAGSACAGSLGS